MMGFGVAGGGEGAAKSAGAAACDGGAAMEEHAAAAQASAGTEAKVLVLTRFWQWLRCIGLACGASPGPGSP